MKRHLCLGFAVALVACAGAQAQTADALDVPPARTSAPAPVSPEVHADRRVTFRVFASKASEVAVTGEFGSRAVPLSKDAEGVWSATVGPIAPELYHYYFTIDRVRAIDLANPKVKTGSTGRTIASILDVPGDAPRFHDARRGPHGAVHECIYDSKTLEAVRRVLVYTPPGYDSAAVTRYPVLYLLHGANADEFAWTQLGRCPPIVDNLIAAGLAKPLIVVMPFGYARPPNARGLESAGRAGSELFRRDLLEDVIPYVEAHFRVRAEREQRAIAGLSMGGGQAVSIGLGHLDRFSHVAGFSAAIQNVNPKEAFATSIADPAATNRALRLLWLGCGTEDSLFAANQRLSAQLAELGIQNVFHSSDGGHTWIVARRYLHELVPKLFRDEK